MAFLDVHFEAPALGKQSSLWALIPQGRGPFPVLYLLHGLSDDHSIWLRRTSLERYTADLPLIVVMPDGHRSFYLNDSRPGGLAYEDHLVKDVVGFCDRVFPTLPRRESRAVAGLSMGGYGALMLALKHPACFGCAASHSGVLAFAHDPVQPRPDLQRLSQEAGPGYDCFRLAERLASKPARQRPALRFDCGTDDFLLGHNRAFHAHLEKIGYPHDYAEHPGYHAWAYWDAHIRETLAFVMAHLRTRQRRPRA